MKRLFPALAAALAISTIAGCDRDPPTGEMSLSIMLYEFTFNLNSRESQSTLTLHVEQEGNCFQLPMRAEPFTATIDQEEPTTAVFENDLLRLCGKGWQAGESIALSVSAHVAEETWKNTQVGYSVSQDSAGQPFYYMVSWIGGCDRFTACDTRPNQFAKYRIAVEHDPDITILCPGTITRHQGLTTCSFQAESAPTYSTFGFAGSSRWQPQTLGNFGSVPTVLYDLPGSITGQIINPSIHSQFMAWMEEQFGAYPYSGELRLAVGPTVWNGFEHPGNIMLTDDLSNRPSRRGYQNQATHVIHHEIAHMWAGNRTTLASARDFVWKEASVEYLTYLFEDEVDTSIRSETTPLAWKTFSANARHYPVPASPPPLVDFYGDSYGPGPLILYRQLEALFSRQQIRAALGEILSNTGALSISMIESILGTTLETDLSGYFNTWLHGAGEPQWPRFSVDVTQNGTQVSVSVTQQENPKGLFGCAFAVELRGAGSNDGEVAEAWFDLGVNGQESATVHLNNINFDVVSHRLDPHGHALVYEARSSAVESPPPYYNPWIASRFIQQE